MAESKEHAGKHPSPKPRRYLGLELAGAKNTKTSLAALEYYPKEHKIFLLDIYEKIVAHEGQSSDEALLEILDEMKQGVAKIGVNVPLELPPCMSCTKKTCPSPGKCTQPAVKWMRDFAKKAARNPSEGLRVREFTSYTQRPIELWIRYQVFPHLHPTAWFDIDETLGGNKAPLTARMHYLKRFLTHFDLVEVWPKLTIAMLTTEMQTPKRTIANYRKLEEGAQARMDILEALSEHHGIFIYDRDLRKLAHSLAAFDAFICAYTALLSDVGGCTKVPAGFPKASGWVEYPRMEIK